MSKQATGDIAIQALYDLMQCADTGEHLTNASTATAEAWENFFGTAGAGVLGDFQTLTGNTVNELGCLQMIASYCDQVLENFLKPLSGLPLVDWGFRYGARDIIGLTNLYTRLRINRPDATQTITTFSVQGDDLWDLPENDPVELVLSGEANYDFNFYFNTTNPDNYLKRVILTYEVEGDPEPTVETWNLPEPTDDEQSWNFYYEIDGRADYIEVTCQNDSGTIKNWIWTG